MIEPLESDLDDVALSIVDDAYEQQPFSLDLTAEDGRLDFDFGAPRISKDGVTVAKEIELPDKFENMGAQMVREVASRTGSRSRTLEIFLS